MTISRSPWRARINWRARSKWNLLLFVAQCRTVANFGIGALTRRSLRLLAERQHLHAEPVAEQIVHVPSQRLGEEQASIAQQQGRPPRQILGEFPGARHELV